VEIALLLVALAVSVLAVTAVADRIDVPAPLVLIVAGVAASYVPGVPEITLEPEVVLLGLLPPLLYATAIQTSLVDFNANRRSILLLSVGLVVFTTLGIGALVHWLIPSVGWGAAFAIGAVVAPPDAVAATAVGRRIGLPRRIVTILEGESLLNDATALVSLRTAIAASGLAAEAADETLTAGSVALDFALAAGGGVAIGAAIFAAVAWLRTHLTDPLMDTAISLVVPFAAYVAAEEVHASGVISVVVAGLLLGHQAPMIQTAQSRIAERINWRTIAFVLENAVFLLIGLQAARLFEDVGDSDLSTARITAACLLTLVGVIVLRLAWVYPARYLLVRPRSGDGTPAPAAYTFLLGWAGMRGVVTLAAAFIIPEETRHREVLLLIAFTVVAGTLLIQGLSLPWITRRLRVPAPDPMDDALARATLLQQASKAGLAELDAQETDDRHGVAELIRQRIDQRNFAAWERLGTTADEESPSELYARLRRAMIDAERARVLEIRSAGSAPSEVVADVLAMLDIEESMLERASEERADLRTSTSIRFPGEECEHLAAHPHVVTGGDGTCGDCLREGSRWVALRECLTCGHVACCDSSSGRHADEHFRATGHPVMQSAEPAEDWRWCYVHHLTA
jgi:CPA1 family monovalent cation:H+ antiporter